MSRKKISYAVIGSGNHALNVFIPALRESYNSKLIAITPSSTLDKWKQSETSGLSDLMSSKILGIDAILSDQSIDAVYISVPNSDHSRIVREALGAGKHIICEKPLCYTEKDIEMLQQRPFSKALLCTGFMYRLHPQYQLLKELLEGEDILEMKGQFFYQSDLSSYNIRNQVEKGGGALLDIGCYLLDAVRYILEPTHLDLDINKLAIESGVDVEVEISGNSISNKDEIKIQLQVSQRKERLQLLELKTKNKLITLESPFLTPRNKKTSINVSNLHGKRETIYMSAFNQVSAQINLFSESIKAGSLLSPLSDGTHNSRDLSSLYSAIHSSH